MIAGARAERAAAVDAAEAEALAASQKSSDVAAAMAKALAEFDGELGGLRDMAAAVDDLRAVLAGEDVAKHLDALAKGRYEKAHLARLTLDAALAAEGERAEKLRASALERARAAVKGRDGQLYEHATLAHVLWSLGEREEALEAFDALRAHSARADLDLPVFRRLAPLAEARGLAADWRPEDVPAVDVGERIALDELGPAYWMPPKAPEWSLPDAFGERHTLASYRGRPVLVVFFLGFGCVHCVEQLQALAPRAGEFAERGIDIVSIGLQSPEDLRVSIGDDPSDTGYPFPVLADPDLAQFKAYRAHDDFEGVALHGTYLVDGEGRVRWLDISHEPFMDVDFLLAESVRLLALPVRTPREARRSPEARAEPAAAETETGSRSGV